MRGKGHGTEPHGERERESVARTSKSTFGSKHIEESGFKGLPRSSVQTDRDGSQGIKTNTRDYD